MDTADTEREVSGYTTGRAREHAVGRIADHLLARPREHPLRVAVDGITAAGKSSLAREITDAVRARGGAAIHLSTDDFHHVAARRHRDPDRAQGYYRDAYDLDAVRRLVLDPLGPHGSRCYRRRLHDLATDQLLDEATETAPANAVVIIDGSFLQSGAAAGGWDEIVWVDTSPQRALERAVPRDAASIGSPDAVRAAYAERYHAACACYVAECRPEQSATIVIDNDDLDNPVLRRLGGPASR